MKIEILGSGCANCRTLEQNAKLAVEQSGIDAQVVKVTEMEKILDYGVMSTPGLVIDGVVKKTGKVLSVEEIKTYLS